MARNRRSLRPGVKEVKGGGRGPTGPRGPGGEDADTSLIRTVNRFDFMFSSVTTEPPSGSQIRLNALPQTATKMWVRNLTVDGADVYRFLMNIIPNTEVYIQDFDENPIWARFWITAPPISKTDYVELPVAPVSQGQALKVQKIFLLTLFNYTLPDASPIKA